MARTVVAIYDDFQAANSAVRELVDNGFPRDNISLIANNRGNTPGTTTAATTGESVADETGAGAGVGAGIGAAVGGIGGLLVGLGALVIPGIGPVLAAGPLAVALSTLTGAGVGAVAGGVTGGLLGALIGLGIPEEEAEYYVEGVRRGGVLVTVQADESNTDQIMSVLNSHNPVDINERAATWRTGGWNATDASAGTGTDPRIDAGRIDASRMDVDRVDDDIADPRRADAELETRGPILSDRVDSDIDHNIHPASGEDLERQRGTWQTSGSFTDTGDMSLDYHKHYDANLASTGYPYDYFAPAYTFGHRLSSDTRYQNRSWDMIESDVRRDWEREHPDTWDRFKAAIRHAWEDVSGQPRDPNRF